MQSWALMDQGNQHYQKSSQGMKTMKLHQEALN